MNYLVAMLNISLPCVMASALVCGHGKKFGWNRRMLVVGSCCAVPINLAFIALSLWLSPPMTIAVGQFLPISITFSLGALTALALIYFTSSLAFHSFLYAVLVGAGTSATLAMALYVGVDAVATSWLPPLSGWDVTDQWGLIASRFIDGSIGANHTFMDVQKHPATIPLIFAWAAVHFHGENNLAAGIYFITLLFLICALLAIFSYARHRGLSSVVSFGSCLCILASPLVENHILIPGYADSMVGQVIVMGCIGMMMALDLRHKALLVMALTCLCLPAFYKNIGYVISIICLGVCALGFVLSSDRLKAVLPLRAWKIILCLSLSLIFFYMNFLIFSGWDITVLGVRNALYPNQGLFVFGGRYMYLGETNFWDIVVAEAHSKFLNASFNVFFVTLIFITLALPSLSQTRLNRLSFRFFPQTLFVCLWAMTFFSLFLDEGYQFARPGSDTGHSRFALFSLWIVPLLIADIIPEVFIGGKTKAASKNSLSEVG